MPTCGPACTPKAQYPAGEDGTKAAGKDVMLVCFAPEGEVVEASPHHPSGHPELDEATRRFALAWRAEPLPGDAPPRRRCRFFEVAYAPPAGDSSDPEGNIQVGWSPEMDDPVAVHEPYHCDESCQQASTPPIDRNGRKLAGKPAFEVCFRGDGTVEKVKLVQSSHRDEVDDAARRHFKRLTADPVPPGTIVPKRCPVLEMDYRAD